MKDIGLYVLVILGTLNTLFLLSSIHDNKKEIKQSKEHHLKYHELIKENHQLNEWYQNHDCDGSYEPCSVSVECDKFEL